MALLTVFKGHVQGVGFRYQTYRIARAFEVQGWVRNVADGSVELLLQGAADQVQAMLEEVRGRMSYHIRTEDNRDIDDDPSLSDFEVRL